MFVASTISELTQFIKEQQSVIVLNKRNQDQLWDAMTDPEAYKSEVFAENWSLRFKIAEKDLQDFKGLIVKCLNRSKDRIDFLDQMVN